jgi:CRP/FNR family transcriptional regulator, anaerobic regulatory protein
MDEFLAMLDKIRPLREDLRAHFLGVMQEQHVRKNEFLVRGGEINGNLFFIKQGLIRCYYIKADEKKKSNREVSIYFFMENDIIASTWSFIHQQPGSEWMVALEDSTVYIISFENLEKTYALFPELNLHGRIITQRYSTIWYTILRGIRTQTARERYRFLEEYFPLWEQRIPAKHLASYLGINAVTLSRIKSGMATGGKRT